MARGRRQASDDTGATSRVAAKRVATRGTKPRPVATRHAAVPPPAARPSSRRPRSVTPEARREAILEAALSVFAEQGFAAARLDDVAARAGIAKGTLYLYFEHKEALFEALVVSLAEPVLAHVGALAGTSHAPASEVLGRVFEVFRREVLETDRKLLIRLVIAEGPRFPAIARLYHKQVVTPGLAMIRGLVARAVKEGGMPASALARFPQLVVAPLIMAVVWDSLFASFEPLDLDGLLAAHRDVLGGTRRNHR